MKGPIRRIEMPDVSPIKGEPLRFFVASRSDANARHLVDLDEFDGNGQCDCWPFSKMRKLLERHGAFPAENLQCWHIKRVLLYQGRQRVYEIMEIVGRNENPKPMESKGRAYALKPAQPFPAR